MTLGAELSKPSIVQFFAVKIEMPGFTARFFQGRGEVTLYGETYTGAGIPGEDCVFGSMESIVGETNSEAPRLRLTLSGLAPSLLSEALNYAVQGSPVTVFDCVVDEATHTPVADPDLAFYGFIDTPTVDAGETLSITLDCASAWEWFFLPDDTARRNDQFHQLIHPGERGYAFATDVSRSLPWGVIETSRAPPPTS